MMQNSHIAEGLRRFLRRPQRRHNYSASTGFVGYVREEAAPHPLLLYFEDGAVDYLAVADAPAALWLSHARNG